MAHSMFPRQVCLLKKSLPSNPIPKIVLLVVFCSGLQFGSAQNLPSPVVIETIKANREKTYTNIINNSITKNLSLPLNDSTEEYWQGSFSSLEYINYKLPWVNKKIEEAFVGIENRSAGFQRALLEMLYANYSNVFLTQVNKLLARTGEAKIFAMCVLYLSKSKPGPANISSLAALTLSKVSFYENDMGSSLIIYSLLQHLLNVKPSENEMKNVFASIKNNNFLKGNTVLFSFQRKNRNFPGLAMIRDSAGNFIRDENGAIFSVPQLARSLSNLPFFLTNGSTPQGIFRMNGFDQSRILAIGPTTNIQLMMPFETNPFFFLKTAGASDTVWTKNLYSNLLPGSLKNYNPLFETYTASLIGRYDIIAHGTTVNPAYYKGQAYYPHTPTEGCLATKEIWSAVDGKRIESNQQKLVDALKKAGGANGYCAVIEIDDQQKAIDIKEILTLLQPAK
jgi:hypothetical protein